MHPGFAGGDVSGAPHGHSSSACPPWRASSQWRLGITAPPDPGSSRLAAATSALLTTFTILRSPLCIFRHAGGPGLHAPTTALDRNHAAAAVLLSLWASRLGFFERAVPACTRSDPIARLPVHGPQQEVLRIRHDVIGLHRLGASR